MKYNRYMFLGTLCLLVFVCSGCSLYTKQSDTTPGLNSSSTSEMSQTATTTMPEVHEDVQAHIDSKSDLIRVTSPMPNETISSPLVVEGQARGYWFFEGDFPIVLVDWDGRIIAESFATAQLDSTNPSSTWMTEDFVNFRGEIEFVVSPETMQVSERGAIIFQKDNPSDLPERDDALEIPVQFSF